MYNLVLPLLFAEFNNVYYIDVTFTMCKVKVII